MSTSTIAWCMALWLPALAGAGCDKNDTGEPDAAVQPEQPRTGHCDAAAVLESHRSEIRQCYQNSRARDPELEGRVVVEWSVNPDGVVTVIRIKQSDMKTPHVAMCILSTIKGWKYPRPWAGARVITESFEFPGVR